MHNLPLERTSFVGRRELLEALCDLVGGEGKRLVTLTGPGGTGKTRLALEAGARLADEFQDGASFVALASVTDADLVLPAVARSLGLKEVAGQDVLVTLQHFMLNRRPLLILDNLEQVLAAARSIAELLSACPGLTILATSREVLHLSGEQEFPVPPLTVPGAMGGTAPEDLAGNEAVRLFTERARAVRPDFALDEGSAALVAEACRRLDGLPLALELAAARLRTLPLPALLQRIEHRLPLLTGGPRDAPARQQTLRAAIGWSYDLLSPNEQTLFRRLSVFRGSTLEAVDEVCCAAATGPGTSSVALPPLDVDVLEGLSSLVEKNLLRCESTPEGQPWYVMLETVREFAQERLEDSGEGPGTRRRHALFCLRLTESADQNLHGRDQVPLLDRLEREHDNFREALRWCAGQGYAEPALRIATALWWFWYVRGYASEGRDWLRSLLERFGASHPNASKAALRVRALEAAGHLAAFQGDLDAAMACHEQNLPVVEQLGDDMGKYRTLQNLGFVSRQRGNWDAAREYFQRCLAVARSSAGPAEIGYAFYNLANLAHDEGRYDEARSLLEESLPLLQEMGDPRQVGNVYLSLSIVALDRGDYEQSRLLSQKSIEQWEQTGDRRPGALIWTNLANVAMAEGDFDEANRLLARSLGTAQEFGDLVAVAGVLERFAVLMAARGEARQALRFAGAADRIREAKSARLPAVVQRRVAADLDPARRALGPAEAEQAYSAGRQLTAGEATAEMLRSVEAVARSSNASMKVTPAAQPLLTARERQIAALVAKGVTNRQIAEALVIAEGTVANHILHILNKLGFSSRTQIGVWSAQQGLLAADESVPTT